MPSAPFAADLPPYRAPTPALRDEILAAVKFDAAGLVTAVAQSAETGEILMVAWMDREALSRTIDSGNAWYYSRSRKSLWRKGESSGQTQTIADVRIDCDGDTVLLLVHQKGVACHTGRANCFFRAPRNGKLVEIAAPVVDPAKLYGE
ncbi:MAG: phosphoribosyl-AMP cyclohydrolase [Gemmatimonas sp.]